MFQEILYGLVGDWGEAAIKWMVANPAIVGAVLVAWMGLLAAGKLQVRRIKARTQAMVLDAANQRREGGNKVAAKQLYSRLYPDWSQMVRRSALFVPHRLEMWPVPATPANVQHHVNFSPEWIYECLTAQGFRLHGAKPKAVTEKAKQIDKSRRRT